MKTFIAFFLERPLNAVVWSVVGMLNILRHSPAGMSMPLVMALTLLLVVFGAIAFSFTIVMIVRRAEDRRSKMIANLLCEMNPR